MKFSWATNSIILSLTSITLLAVGHLLHQPAIWYFGCLFLLVTGFGCGAAYMEEGQRRKDQAENL